MPKMKRSGRNAKRPTNSRRRDREVTPYYEADGITLYCADCREVGAWLTADVLVCDPPYGMAFESSWTTRRPILGDHDESLRDDILLLWGERPAAVFGTWRVARPQATKQLLTWFKSSVGPGMGDLNMPWGCATEEIYILGDGWHGRRRANVIETSEQRGGSVGIAALLGHPTPKPVGLITQLLECAPAGVVADPFAGTGSTLLAARQLGRRAIGVEVVEKYCETAAERLTQLLLDFG